MRDEAGAVLAELVLDDLLLGIERDDIAQSQRPDRDVDELLFGDAGALPLLREVVAAGHEQGFLGDEADELAPRHPQAELAGQAAGLVEDDVHAA